MNKKEYLKLLKGQDDMISKFIVWLSTKKINKLQEDKNGS